MLTLYFSLGRIGLLAISLVFMAVRSVVVSDSSVRFDMGGLAAGSSAGLSTPIAMRKSYAWRAQGSAAGGLHSAVVHGHFCHRVMYDPKSTLLKPAMARTDIPMFAQSKPLRDSDVRFVRRVHLGRYAHSAWKDSRGERRCGAVAAEVPALFTAAQAAIGKEKFMKNCARCHGVTMEGRSAPALKGANFASAKANFDVSTIFGFMSQNMPATDPGGLAQEDYVQVMAYLLLANGYPSGSKALTFDDANHSKAKFLYHDPGG